MVRGAESPDFSVLSEFSAGTGSLAGGILDRRTSRGRATETEAPPREMRANLVCDAFARAGGAYCRRHCHIVALGQLLASPTVRTFGVAIAGFGFTPACHGHYRVRTRPLTGRRPILPLHADLMRIAVEICSAGFALTGEADRRNQKSRCEDGRRSDCSDGSHHRDPPVSAEL